MGGPTKGGLQAGPPPPQYMQQGAPQYVQS